VKRIRLAAAVGAVGIAALAMTACSNFATPSASPSTPAASHGVVAQAAQGGCGQQYRSWAQGQGKGLITALDAVGVASTAGAPQILTAELKKARPAVTKAARYPVPGCADPMGYWGVLMMHMSAAEASSSSVASARAAMKGVPKIQRELTAEVHALTG
jgi:hypothetical protein